MYIKRTILKGPTGIEEFIEKKNAKQVKEMGKKIVIVDDTQIE